MTKCITRHGVALGAGAAINVELGFIPNSVEVYNATDGTLITTEYLIPWVVPFSGGGTAEILSGATIRGVTSGATALVQSVLATATTWSAGTAAGFLTLVEGSLVGTFQSENIVITNLASGVLGTDDATVTVNVIHGYNNNSAAVGAVTTAATSIARYEGTAASASKGFTIGATVAVSAKLLRWRAFRDDA
jgi:hypothetical protein